MPRQARFIEPNGFYHIISRSLNEMWILRDNADFEYFKQLAYTAKEKFPIRLFHYVVMNTHFHMVLQASDHTTLSKHIAFLKWHYTIWMRKKYNWKGPLWRERYKSLPIENEDYLYACGMYIEYNPVRAGICAAPEDYPHSSYREYRSSTSNNLLDDYEMTTELKPSIQVDYGSEITKNIFSLCSAIGSSTFIKQFKNASKCLSQK
ncbi:MAG: transposase [Candidatus Omnitrophica bacterium]|nr:transposase [Candidatus Omnitrophota bacterium]